MQSKKEMNKKVVVAVSGGVDSSGSLLLLIEKGYEPVALHFDFLPHKKILRDELASLCLKLGVPYQEINITEYFSKTVIDPFIRDYQRGLTPNPCMHCNKSIKWHHLIQFADEQEIPFVATGHYATIANPTGNRWEIIRDPSDPKDQSYMLWRLSQSELCRTIFPLSGIKKENIRNLVAQHQIQIASQKESQDICFIDGRDYQEYLLKRGLSPRRGDIVDKTGKVRGEHLGFWNYTIGQRRGLGISNPEPLYVIALKSEKNQIVVGVRSDLDQWSTNVTEVNFIKYPSLDRPLPVMAKVRYQQRDIPATITQTSETTLSVQFDSAVSGITPGQGFVCYENNSLVAGGIIAPNRP